MSDFDLITAIDSVIPTGEQQMLAQFNAASGTFITCMSVIDLSYLNTENFKYVEITIDITKQRVDGEYDNFKIVNVADEPTVIYESMVNELCKQKIFKRFAVEVQLDILRNTLATLCEKVGVEDEALLDMNDYIDGVKRANKVLKEAYKNNPDFQFISIQEQAAIEAAKLDGGLHEIMGPKNLIGLGLTLNAS